MTFKESYMHSQSKNIHTIMCVPMHNSNLNSIHLKMFSFSLSFSRLFSVFFLLHLNLVLKLSHTVRVYWNAQEIKYYKPISNLSRSFEIEV